MLLAVACVDSDDSSARDGVGADASGGGGDGVGADPSGGAGGPGGGAASSCVRASPCPDQAPAAGQSCLLVNQECRYFPEPNLAEAIVATCAASEVWEVSIGYFDGVGVCPDSLPTARTPCDPASNGSAACYYAPTACSCLTPNFPQDAPSTWVCQDMFHDPCPDQPPVIGTCCSNELEGLSCSFDLCYPVTNEQAVYYTACENGAWVQPVGDGDHGDCAP